MSNSELESRIRRILVALDASPHSRAALQAAVELAERLDAELEGLFVEDVNLLRLAELPFAREMDLLSLRSRDLDREYLRRQLRAQASRVQQAMARLAEPAEIAWSFRVVQGAIAAELLEAADEADLTVLGRAGWSVSTRRRLGSTARTVVIQTRGSTLVLQQGARLGLPVLVVYDGSSVSRKALLAATQLLEGRSAELLVVILAERSEDAEALQIKLDRWLGERDLELDYRWLREVSVEALMRIVHEEGCRVLVLPSPAAGLEDDAAPELLERLDCPVFLVR
jgi:nucleotide-binding universal stress UspA family protein